MSGPPRTPTALRRLSGNPGKRGYNPDEPVPPPGTPDCPDHLDGEARAEWHRLVDTLVAMGVVTVIDRGVLAAYCTAWGRWVEAEEKLKETPPLIRTPSGHVQQSPWLSIANRQMELMGRYMAEIGLTPASRSRIAAFALPNLQTTVTIRRVIIGPDADDEDPSAGDGQDVPENRSGTLVLPASSLKL